MALTADDIVNYPLKQTVRGYSVTQVDELLDQVAEELERRAREHEDLRDRLERAQRQLDESSETEAMLKRTLVTAQRAAEQSLEEARERAASLVDDARREAAAIVEQSRLEAEELRVEALHAVRAEEAEIRNRRSELETRVEALRIFERDMRSRLRTQLEEQLRALDEVGSGPATTEPVDTASADVQAAPDVDVVTGDAETDRVVAADADGPDQTAGDHRDVGDLEPLDDLWAEYGFDRDAGGVEDSPGRMSG